MVMLESVDLSEIAKILLNDMHLMVYGAKCQIVEIETYLRWDRHPDVFTHCDKEQLEHATLYFHRIHGKGFKEGSFKGMDITFGEVKGHQVYGGALIRSIQTPDGLMEGPCVVVNYILKRAGFGKVCEMVPTLSTLNVDDATCPIHLIRCDDNRSDRISMSPRVGLTLKGSKDVAKLDYIMKPYRFTTCPELLKKQKNTIVLADENFSSARSRYRNALEKGSKLLNADEFYGSSMTSEKQAQLFGFLSKKLEDKKED